MIPFLTFKSVEICAYVHRLLFAFAKVYTGTWYRKSRAPVFHHAPVSSVYILCYTTKYFSCAEKKTYRYYFSILRYFLHSPVWLQSRSRYRYWYQVPGTRVPETDESLVSASILLFSLSNAILLYIQNIEVQSLRSAGASCNMLRTP